MPRYRDEFDRETQAVAWRAPDGRVFLVCGTGEGYALRSPEEWESDDSVEFVADPEGDVYFEGDRVGWNIPRGVLEKTVF